MTIDTTDQQAVTVAQEDFDWLADAFEKIGATATAGSIRSGVPCIVNSRPVVEAIARHRLASVSSASVDGIKACIALCEHMEADKSLPDEAGNAAWNLKVGMRHLLKQASASPEPVPATNQAGEVERLIEYLFGDQRNGDGVRVVDLCFTAFMNRDKPNPEDGEKSDWFTDTKPLIDKGIADLKGRLLAALATQPATSQEGEERAAIVSYIRRQSDRGADIGNEKPKGSTARAAFGGGSLALKRVADNIEAGEHVINDNAATPTPPTLSEDLREALKPFADAAADYDYADGQPAFEDCPDDSSLPEINDLTVGDLRAARAALAQVKAS
jgi:hypothetical protein